MRRQYPMRWLWAFIIPWLVACGTPRSIPPWKEQVAYAITRAQQVDPRATLVSATVRPALSRDPMGVQSVSLTFALGPEVLNYYRIEYEDRDMVQTWRVNTNTFGMDIRDRMNEEARARHRKIETMLDIGPADAIRRTHERAEQLLKTAPLDWVVSLRLITDPRVQQRWGIGAVWKMTYFTENQSLELWVDAHTGAIVEQLAPNETLTLGPRTD